MPQPGPTVTVHYNPNAPQPFVITPPVVSIGREDDNLVWVRQAGESWIFAAIRQKDYSQLPNPPFLNVAVGPDQITVEDDNTSGSGITYNYQIGIQEYVGGPIIWSDPQIINRPD